MHECIDMRRSASNVLNQLGFRYSTHNETWSVKVPDSGKVLKELINLKMIHILFISNITLASQYDTCDDN